MMGTVSGWRSAISDRTKLAPMETLKRDPAFMADAAGTAPKTYRITFESGESFDCREGEKVLAAMERARLRTIQIGCRGGGCGACRVQILQGDCDRLRMGKNHVDDDEAATGFALSCRIVPTSDMVLRNAVKTPVSRKKNAPQKRPRQHHGKRQEETTNGTQRDLASGLHPAPRPGHG